MNQPDRKFDINLRQEQGNKPSKEVTPAFEIGGIPYFTELPTPPETKPRQTVLALDEPGVKEWVEGFISAHNERESDPAKHKKLAWSQTDEGLENAGFGTYKHSIVVEYDAEGDLTNYAYDMVMWNDGVINKETGLANPGAVVVPLERIGDAYYIHCSWQ